MSGVQAARPGGRIPPELWAVAVDMAAVHGVYRMSKELRLDYSGLKRRLKGVCGEVGPGKGGEPRFVELVGATPARAARLSECVIELHNRRGATMRVELNGAGLAGLAGVCSGFLGVP